MTALKGQIPFPLKPMLVDFVIQGCSRSLEFHSGNDSGAAINLVAAPGAVLTSTRIRDVGARIGMVLNMLLIRTSNSWMLGRGQG